MLRSRYGATAPLNENQYLAELMCERQAKKDRKDLPDRFWRLPAYERAYALQCRQAAALLKLYPLETILAVLRTSGKNAYSLGAKWLHPLFKAAHEARPQPKPQVEMKQEVKPPIDEVPRPTFSHGKSALDKLRGLDG
jgi:hypothetical protein